MFFPLACPFFGRAVPRESQEAVRETVEAVEAALDEDKSSKAGESTLPNAPNAPPGGAVAFDDVSSASSGQRERIPCQRSAKLLLSDAMVRGRMWIRI